MREPCTHFGKVYAAETPIIPTITDVGLSPVPPSPTQQNYFNFDKLSLSVQ